MHYDNILIIADTQAPFQHKDYLKFLNKLKAKYCTKNGLVIHAGDEVDFHAFSSKYKSDPDGMSPGHELIEAKRFMRQLYALFPHCHVCISNHGIRPIVKAFNAGLPKSVIKDMHEILEAPKGWKWALKWEFNNIRFEHGENVSGYNAALNAAMQNRMSTVIGHQHAFAGVTYSQVERNLIYGMNVGCGIDVDAYAFAYAKLTRNKPVLGAGLILDNVPYFMPMLLDKNKNWIGVVP